ncbi:hypothetical protein [Natrinema sp. 1APR25-10V2]|uniref:hypothetical protein n=1 Tax=Natrinema sp. 1APR25-10V2 TaxID=2951081 RepID=UPI0028753448|nr:hypothetical protein [Natrinema sp. 1APR25-10V2]MDS0476141.1 hypothetical protein [Natrinema sp. 1APR25-10V2]
MQIDVVDDLKQPEYTGENRCEPCTVLNLVIAAVVGSLVARKSRLGGLVAVGVSLALIYLRGYLVPGTPTLTKRYLPPAVLRWFGKEPEPEVASGLGGVDTATPLDVGTGSADPTAPTTATDDVATFDEGDIDDADTVDETESTADRSADGQADTDDAPEITDLETFFLDHEVLEPCADRDDLCLTDAFEADWFDEIEPLDEAGVDAAAAVDAFGFDADPDEFQLDSQGDTYRLLSRSGGAGRWPSRAALIADVAASRSLSSWVDDWDAVPPETKGEILNGLRMFLETCPSGGTVQMGEEVVESCCSSHEVVAVTCEETGERLFEQRLADVDA